MLPLIDPDIPVLARHRDNLRIVGARVAVLSPEAAAVTADKWHTMHFFRRLGLPTPRSWLPGQSKHLPGEYPIFIKPRDGSASERAFVARDEREYAFFIHYVRNAIAQEYLPGPELTTDVMCDLDGEILAAVSRQRIKVRSGEVEKGVTVCDPRVLDASAAIAKALGAIGPITVQCMMKNDTPYFTEVNARLGGGFPLGLAAGADSLRWLLAKTAGLPATIPPVGGYRTGVYMTRFDDSFFLTDPASGILQASPGQEAEDAAAVALADQRSANRTR